MADILPNQDVQTPVPRKTTGGEIGKSGTIIQNGMITGEDYNRVLTGLSAIQKYEIMRRSDSGIRGTLQICKLPILSTTWSFQPAQQPDGTITPADQEIADFMNREFFNRNINFHDFIRQALTMFDFGFSVFEQVLELTEFNGKKLIGIQKLASRKQLTIYAWTLPDGTPGITQRTINETFYIPWDKLVVFTHDKEGDNYQGISLLRYVYKDWDIKDKLGLVQAIALEKMAVGVPVIKQDPLQPNAIVNPNDLEAAEDALKQFRANEKGYIKAPPGMMIEMLDMKASTTKDVLPYLTYLDSRIAKSVLAGFMEIGGSSGSGAQALAKDLSSLFMKSEEAVANVIKSTIMEQLVHQICDLNFTDMPNGYPQLTYGSIGDDDISVFSEAVNKLMTAGALTSDIETEERVREIINLPAMSKEAKNAFAQKQELAKQALEQPKLGPDGKPLDDTTGKGEGKDTKKDAPDTTDKTKAALRATNDAQRKIIEVIFADED
jgi:phage gp29-like protein